MCRSNSVLISCSKKVVYLGGFQVGELITHCQVEGLVTALKLMMPPASGAEQALGVMGGCESHWRIVVLVKSVGKLATFESSWKFQVLASFEKVQFIYEHTHQQLRLDWA